jgi:LysM repeat protein
MDNVGLDPERLRPPAFTDGDPGYQRRSRRERTQGSLLARQLALIVGANAVISLVISLVVVRCAAPAAVAIPTATGTEEASSAAQVEVTTTPADVGQPAEASPVGEADAPPTPTTARPAEPVTHIVAPGDTLSTIAARYRVSLEDLMKANGIANPDYLMLGQELIVPIGGMPIVTPTFTPAPAPTPTPIPFDPPTPLPPGATPVHVPAATILPSPTPVPTLTPVPAGELRLSLTVLNPGDPVNEAVYIVNQGLFVRMAGWTLSNGRDAPYVFPEFGLGGNGAAVNIHTGGGSDSTADLYWGRPTTAWRMGDTATLSDQEGKVVIKVRVEPTPTPAP